MWKWCQFSDATWVQAEMPFWRVSHLGNLKKPWLGKCGLCCISKFHVHLIKMLSLSKGQNTDQSLLPVTIGISFSNFWIKIVSIEFFFKYNKSSFFLFYISPLNHLARKWFLICIISLLAYFVIKKWLRRLSLLVLNGIWESYVYLWPIPVCSLGVFLVFQKCKC